MSDVSKIKSPDGTLYDIKDKVARWNQCVIIGTQTKSTNAWTGVAPFPTLEDGQRILYFLPWAGTSSNATLNLTLTAEDGTTTNTTGAKAVYISGYVRMTTHYGVSSFIALVYRKNGITYSGTTTLGEGWWAEADRDADSNNNLRVGSFKAKAGSKGIYGNQLIMRTGEDTWESLTSVRSIGTDKTKNTSGFYLDNIIFYNESDTATSGKLIASWDCYKSVVLDFRYSSNCGSTLTPWKPVYLVGTIADNVLNSYPNNEVPSSGTPGLFYLADTWYSQDLPTTEDGKVYIYLGEACGTTAVTLMPDHPIFEFIGGRVRTYVPKPKVTGSTASVISNITTAAMPSYVSSVTPTNASVSGTTLTITLGSSSITALSGSYITNKSTTNVLSSITVR